MDVAGGKGDLAVSFLMQKLVKFQMVMVDPRPATGDFSKTQRKHLRKQAGITLDALPFPVTPLRDYFRILSINCIWAERDDVDLICTWVDAAGSRDDSITAVDVCENVDGLPVLDSVAVDAAAREADIIVGLHPDQPTADIVSYSVAHRKPFAVIPCCVFYRLYPHRRLKSGQPVHTREDLIEYLLEMHPSIKKRTLPFEGANTVVYCFEYED